MGESSKGHPIRVAARRTGTPETTLRAWERRYGAVSPARAETGRRLYSDEDIERLILIRQAVDGGRAISGVAGLSAAELQEMVRKDQAAAAMAESSGERGDRTSEADLIERCMTAVKEMDARSLSSLLSRAAIRLTALALIDEVIMPLLHRIGDDWYRNRLSPRHEHLATTTVRSVLSQIRLGSQSPGAETIVIGTPAGQLHDLGTEFVAAVGVTEGWNVLNLGANVPAHDIVLAASDTNARVVALSIVHPSDDPRVEDAFAYLGEHLSPSVTLVVGGQAVDSYRTSVEAAGGIEIQSSRALSVLLANLSKQ